MNYQYEACNRQGEHFQGAIEAASRQEAAHIIRRQGLWITHLSCKDNIIEHKGTYFYRLLLPTVGDAQIALFCRQMSVLLGAGIPVHEALKSLLAGGRQGGYSRLLKQLYQHVLKGNALSAAMEESNNFSPRIIRLIAAGECAGTLEETFSRLADYLAKTVKAREQLKSILLYPAIIGITALVMLIFMTVFILPAFASMLYDLHADLPLPTQMLLSLSAFLQAYTQETMLASCIIGISIWGLWRSPVIHCACHRILLSLPLIGEMARHAAWSLICSTLAMLLEQGLPLHDAIKTTAPVTGNRYIEHELMHMQSKVRNGCSLLSALRDCGSFPSILQEMLDAGEQAGQLEIMLLKAADFCAVMAENESARLQALAEPVAILTVGGLVFFMVMSIIMPLLNTMDVLSM